ncbi:MAG: NUDIX domain-containing protein [Acidimicrobiia bacterium]|nr:NUDIX domain-containing protein [Acidimicrobiia bacterium]
MIPVIGVGAIITDNEGRVLVVRRGRPPGKGLWAVPGGKVRFGESLVQTAAREIAEETGLTIDVGEVAWVGEALGSGSPPSFHIVLVDFWASVTSGADRVPRAGDDADDIDWVDPRDSHRELVPSMYRMFEDLYGAALRSSHLNRESPATESEPIGTAALPPGDRPFTDESYETADLPATPTRTFRIPASGWVGAPDVLIRLGDELGEPVEYKRRIGRFLLWRAGPPVGQAEYMAVDAESVDQQFRFRLSGKTGEGWGPDGQRHERFRTWKEALRDA